MSFLPHPFHRKIMLLLYMLVAEYVRIRMTSIHTLWDCHASCLTIWDDIS